MTNSPHTATLLVESGQFELHTVHAVDAVNEKNEDEDEGDLAGLLA